MMLLMTFEPNFLFNFSVMLETDPSKKEVAMKIATQQLEAFILRDIINIKHRSFSWIHSDFIKADLLKHNNLKITF